MDLYSFARESDEIEGIYDVHRHIIHEEALNTFLATDISRHSLMEFVSTIEPYALPRLDPSQRVRIGNHIPPPGGDQLWQKVDELLELGTNIVDTHVRYEMLHPFTDGNGRSGRAIWLYQMIKTQSQDVGLGFLHQFYYQVLDYVATHNFVYSK